MVWNFQTVRVFFLILQQFLRILKVEKSLILNNVMMLGSKGLLPPTDAYELLRCKAAPAIL